jgi:hypothetical protein
VFFLTFSFAVGQGPDPDNLYIEALSYAGSGCPQHSIAQSISSDRSSFTLIFDKYVASLGPGIPITENRKNCRLNLKIHSPGGWTFDIISVDTRGYVQLNEGVHALTDVDFYPNLIADIESNNPHPGAVDGVVFNGPMGNDYHQTQSDDKYRGIRIPCSSSSEEIFLGIDFQVQLWKDEAASANAQGLITQDSIDGKLSAEVKLRWRQCTPSSSSPNPEDVYVQSVTYGGSGCPPNTVRSTFSNDRREFVLSFDSFIASVGPSVLITKARRDCQLNIDIRVPYGWTFDLVKQAADGYVQLPKGLKATLTRIFYMNKNYTSTDVDFWKGARQSDYNSVSSLKQRLFSPNPCGKVIPLNVKLSATITGPTTTANKLSGQFTIDSISQLQLEWRRTKKNKVTNQC